MLTACLLSKLPKLTHILRLRYREFEAAVRNGVARTADCLAPESCLHNSMPIFWNMEEGGLAMNPEKAVTGPKLEEIFKK